MLKNQTLDNYPDVLSVADVQEILGIGREQAYILVNNQQFPVKKVGKRLLIYKPTFIDWLKA
ncbi:helix-turn-helix domain-containing protein [Bacillus sp. E214]|uniref:helix-turn-helix domain-containing protein n=1 Tax=Bacillus sp. E214 TaxID=2587156 RepID=UPI0011DF6A49|nr:helix-turn-helix domain-containing protein [Bacillus sp. E214]